MIVKGIKAHHIYNPITGTTTANAGVSEATVIEAPAVRKFKDGQRVRAKYKGTGGFFFGTITRRARVHYEILFDDLKVGTGVKEEHIMKVDSPIFEIGESIEGNYKGISLLKYYKNKWYPGVIVGREEVEGHLRYKLKYDDGEEEDGLYAQYIRAVSSTCI